MAAAGGAVVVVVMVCVVEETDVICTSSSSSVTVWEEPMFLLMESVVELDGAMSCSASHSWSTSSKLNRLR